MGKKSLWHEAPGTIKVRSLRSAITLDSSFLCYRTYMYAPSPQNNILAKKQQPPLLQIFIFSQQPPPLKGLLQPWACVRPPLFLLLLLLLHVCASFACWLGAIERACVCVYMRVRVRVCVISAAALLLHESMGACIPVSTPFAQNPMPTTSYYQGLLFFSFPPLARPGPLLPARWTRSAACCCSFAGKPTSQE